MDRNCSTISVVVIISTVTVSLIHRDHHHPYRSSTPSLIPSPAPELHLVPIVSFPVDFVLDIDF
jgi:hypothetical protein